MDFRKTFDRIPEDFDKYRPRYREEVFRELTSVCKLGPDKKVLEIGPGTGQATELIFHGSVHTVSILRWRSRIRPDSMRESGRRFNIMGTGW